MNWHEIDNRLIKRGEILLLDFVNNYEQELEELNKHKEDHTELPIIMHNS